MVDLRPDDCELYKKEQGVNLCDMSVIDLSTYGVFGNGFNNYCVAVRDSNKKKHNPLIFYEQAKDRGYYTHLFNKYNFIPDMHEINHSKIVRCGKVMRASYRRSITDMGGYPTEFRPIVTAPCQTHYRAFWGAFKGMEGYRQGEIITNEKLVGYVSLVVLGEIAFYSMILGHGDYLKDGIMRLLHFDIMKRLFKSPVRYVMYGGHYDGGINLMRWKKHLLFERIMLCDMENISISS